MEKMFLEILLVVVGVSGAVGKYVYYGDYMTWSEAQDYCRRRHTDLAPVSVEGDEARLSDTADTPYNTFGWIGLYRDPRNSTGGWAWSGGTYVTGYQNWAYHLSSASFACAYTYLGKWYKEDCDKPSPVFCFNVVVVAKEKTWEQALWHCRKHHSDLVSLLSETEVLLALRAIRKTTQTPMTRPWTRTAAEERWLWTGLRYLGDRWLWVNGDPVERWGEEGGRERDACPWRDGLCGAITAEGRWEGRDCDEKLHFICY